MMKRTDSQNYKGFTLIELLIVISIISLLASILFPVFSRARENARRTSCQSNLKQIGIGVMMYVQDYDERYPYCTTTTPTVLWYQTLAPYTAPYNLKGQLFRCPSSYKKQTGISSNDFGVGNYTANRAVLVDGDAGSTAPLSIAAVTFPSATYMIFDGSGSRMQSSTVAAPRKDRPFYVPGTGPGSADNITTAIGSWSFPELEGDFESGRHFGGVNMLYADGHVKWLQSHDLVTEARPCGSGSCFPKYNSTVKSAWNALSSG